MLKGKMYCINGENIMAHEMIGLEVKAFYGTKELVSGIVVDETKNTFKIENRHGLEKIVPKKGNVFEFVIGDEKAVVEGKNILYSPAARLKALWRN
jgi:ribonuclease P protein subunit POP4